MGCVTEDNKSIFFETNIQMYKLFFPGFEMNVEVFWNEVKDNFKLYSCWIRFVLKITFENQILTITPNLALVTKTFYVKLYSTVI